MDLREAEITRLRVVVAQLELKLAETRRELAETQRELAEERARHDPWRSDAARVSLAADIQVLDLLARRPRTAG